jgi:hypothetical protein
MLRQLLVTSILLIGVRLHTQKAYASTTINYSSACKYFNSRGELQVSTTCQVNWGTLGVSGGARYIVTFPNGAEIEVYIYTNGEVETNGISSSVSYRNNNVVIKTIEGEVFIFKRGGQNRLGL